MSVDRVVDDWAGAELNRLLDHVYFHTTPMQGAQRATNSIFRRSNVSVLIRSSSRRLFPTRYSRDWINGVFSETD